MKLSYITHKSTGSVRYLLAAVLELLSCLCVSAQSDPHRLTIAGDGVYLIGSKDDYMALVNNPEYWSGRHTFVQMVDIDLEGEEITPIGNVSQPFTGIYEGRGHTIENAVMHWDRVPDFNYGLFGYICGTSQTNFAAVRHLNIKNITITRSDDAPEVMWDDSKSDIKIGVLVGQLSENAQIHDISISGCRINDGGRPTTVKAILSGGVAGDLYKNASQTTGTVNNAKFVFKNISAGVDIDFTNVKRKTGESDPQFFAGGILGRVRSAKDLSFVPQNTVFTGTIKAPLGMESPTVANMRAGGGDIGFSGAVITYAGDVGTEADGFVTPSTAGDEAFATFCSTRLYYGYNAYNSVTKAVEEVNATNPSGGNYAYGTRTFESNADASGEVLAATGWTLNNQAHWGRVQGVNFGKWCDPVSDASARQQAVDMLNGTVVTTPQYDWVWSSADNTFQLTPSDVIDEIKVYIEPDYTANVYCAKMAIHYKGTIVKYLDYSDGTIEWESTTSLTNPVWSPVVGETGNTIPVNNSVFFRFRWTYMGQTWTSDYIAPSRTVYVLNRETNADFNAAVNQTVIPTFDHTAAGFELAGSDSQDGLTPQTAVKTMARAFELLDEYGDMKTNRIVVMGYYMDEDYLKEDTYQKATQYLGPYNKPATITGTDNASINGGIFAISRSNAATEVAYYLQAPLRFDNVALCKHFVFKNGALDKGSKYNNDLCASGLFFYCNYFDITFDQNVEMINFKKINTGLGLPGDIQSMPFINLVGGTFNNKLDQTLNPIQYGNDTYPDKKGYCTEPGITTINIHSGVFARLICCARNNVNNTPSYNVAGSYQVPNRIRLNVNIKDDIDIKNGIESTKYCKTIAIVNKKVEFVSGEASHNIGLISGGQTDGSAWGDVEMNIYAAHIARIITSNISFGRVVNASYPPDSFWGRAILNVYGKYERAADGTVTSETTINEMFGGMLGRLTQATGKIQPYFYGKSIINMYGGYIGAYTGTRTDNNLSALLDVEPNLYGVGSGGVSGLGTDEHHTSDPCIPYIKADGTVGYSNYDNIKKNNATIPTLTMADGEVIDMHDTRCEVNLYSGIILGSVYGGGYGYSNNIGTAPIDSTYTINKVSYTKPVLVYQRAPRDLGVLYGDSKVTMYRHPDYIPPVVLGNVYGSGAGSSVYAEHYAVDFPTEPNKFLGVASQYGNTEVIIDDGTVGDAMKSTGGDVYGGSQGIQSPRINCENIAALYGSTNLTINGGTIYGNIYGGSELANINSHTAIENSGNTNVTVNGGIIGNNIFGGSKGIDSNLMAGQEDAKARIAGSTNVTVNGGDFLAWPYVDLTGYFDSSVGVPSGIDIVNNRDQFRTFNIYGGGYMNCDIAGDANLNVYSSLLCNEASIVPHEQNPNSLDVHNVSRFQSAYMDITYRCFCVYGGGFGEKTNVRNANVYVTIPRDRAHVSQPHGMTLDRFLDHQSFFDIAGGGYSGDVGYWASPAEARYGVAANSRISDVADLRGKVKTGLGIDKTDAEMTEAELDQVNTELVKMYDHYVGGACRVTIDDYTFARKVMGGGFYGSCLTTDTHVRCGSLSQVYGGSLLGYVHNRASLQFGNRPEDFVWWNNNTNSYVFSASNPGQDYIVAFRGDYDLAQTTYSNAWQTAESYAKELNDYIFITDNIYGGNDVKGIIGTRRFEAPHTLANGDPVYCIDETDGGPLYCTDVDPSERKGIVFNIYGGTFMGDVYSAGNGHYRGYYVPEWVRYNDGPARMYRSMISSVQDDSKPGVEYSNAYRSRPMVGSVNVNLRGNSTDDYIKLHGNFFGGGRECTIGQFNTILPLEDPRRLVQGGHLHVNFGGYVHVDGNVYMGAEGRQYGDQQCVPAAVGDLKEFNGSTTRELAKLGDAAYDHWYYDMDQKCYMPGYPAAGDVDGNFGLKGEHMLNSYMQNVQMQGDVELTFFRYLYERDPSTNLFIYENGDRVRKHWLPGEVAIDMYDSEDVRMRSFFLGGLSGSMTNNNVMAYTYPAEDGKPEYKEKWGTIYRITLPRGVTVHDKVVMGSENAFINYYPYTDTKCTALDKTDGPMYTYKGGLITQHTFSYDLVHYNYHNSLLDEDFRPVHSLPSDFYDDGKYDYIKNANSIDIIGEDGTTTTVKRVSYAHDGSADKIYNTTIRSHNHIMDSPRYDLAWIGEDGEAAYIGPREARAVSDERTTVTKLTAVCQFEPLAAKVQGSDPDDHSNHYGGLIYGGCYNSGIVMGDVVMNIGSNLLGSHLDEAMNDNIGDFASLRHNIGRVFGGGFGGQTVIEGDTYVNLLRNFTGMNIFGGGMEGDVTGTAHVTYIGTETNSYVFGSIYGGGLRGNVGTREQTQKATDVRLFSGNVQNVYGGSCMGNLYGRAYVELCDDVIDELDHLDLSRLNRDSWGGSRLIAGKVFGGNDVAGTITKPLHGTMDLSNQETLMFGGFTTGVYVHEKQGVTQTSSGTGTTPAPNHAPEDEGPGKNSPGSKNGYNGFPLIGDLFGGSNGDYGVQGPEKYISGQVVIATGDSIATKVINLGPVDPTDPNDLGMDVPHIEHSHIVINGGTVINAYGGGDMCNITDTDKITVDYPARKPVDGTIDIGATESRAGFATVDELDRVWSVLHFSSDQQRDEVTETDADGHPIFIYQIYRLFGGNNNADMDIQPDWTDLHSGYIGSLYSGGNFGKMTYYQPKVEADPANNVEAVDEAGLTLTVDSKDLIINNVYGGGRVGDIDPDVERDGTVHIPSPEFYGATLNIYQGIIDHVYGGNDVSGYVSYGTNVNLYGAISGDVYCAGNGNYLYKYDRTASEFDYHFDSVTHELETSLLKIREDYAFRTDAYQGARYFLLPAKTDYGFSDGQDYTASDAETVMAINSYRPHVERAKIYIAGSEDNKVWVRGNVYCGGNSAAVVPKVGSTSYDVKFDIGSHVILNGVFLGSNGAGLADGRMISDTERLNGLEGTPLKMTAAVPSTTRLRNQSDQTVKTHPELYPNVLDLYMRAVETTQAPDNFRLDPTITDAYIGEFCVGGNRGSMMTDRRISLDFPESITIYGRIIGGCKNANVTYNNVTHVGGLTMPLDGEESVKVDMKVRSRFQPLALLYPDPDADPGISMYYYMVDADGNEIPQAQQATYAGKKLYMNQQCNIFGGCYTSGKTLGDIHIDVYSDMLNYDGADATEGHAIDKQAVINGMTDTRSWRAFTVVGGGYGANTSVYGNIDVRMLPGVVTRKDNNGNTSEVVTHPSMATLFGGSQEGLVVGNTNVEIRDGKVLANVYGASEAAKMYGSTSVIVGYPRYYRAKVTGNYRIKRADNLSVVSKEDLKDAFGEVVVPKTVAYKAGDIVPGNILEMITGRVTDKRINEILGKPEFVVGKNVLDTYVTPINSTNIDTYFEKVVSTASVAAGQTAHDHVVPADFGVSWDEITIWIGDQGSNLYPDARPYYGQGNVYGGGYIPNSSDRTLIGQPTIMRYTPHYNLGLVEPMDDVLDNVTDDDAKRELCEKFTELYGGNTAVMIWDNDENADMSRDISTLRDHVHIGTGYFKEVELKPGASVKGYFEKVEKTFAGPDGVLGNEDDVTGTAYVYLTNGKTDTKADGKKKFYEKMADGGVYGGGRKVFAEAFRSIDLAYYGYAEHTPQEPKLLNTIQRADVATITDCCMELVGASDFTVNDYKGVYYAINRVGELRMYTSLNPSVALDKGYVDTKDGIRIHSQKRSRNYIALYNKTNHLGAYVSNWAFDGQYHNGLGALSDKVDGSYGYPNGTGKLESYVNHKHRYIDMFKPYAELRNKYNNGESFTLAEAMYVYEKYNTFSGKTITIDTTDPKTYFEALQEPIESLFMERNVGTAGNMIGISSGYALSFEGLARQPEHHPGVTGEALNSIPETVYYGPTFGVTEMKILTVVSGMGGGYVYALNHHCEKDDDNRCFGKNFSEDPSNPQQDYLQVTGNFVFPGADYQAVNDDNGVDDKHNYIIDDCYYDYYDMEHGFYTCERDHDKAVVKTSAPGQSRAAAIHDDINDTHEVHYWYVSGNTYVYNVTLTCFTSDDHRQFWLSNENDRISLFNVKAPAEGQKSTEIKVTDVTWFVHNEIPEGACDVTNMKKDYTLYLTLDHETKNTYTDTEHPAGAYVIRVPRYSYKVGVNSEFVEGTSNPDEVKRYINSITGADADDYADLTDKTGAGVLVDPNYYLNTAVNNNQFGGSYTETVTQTDGEGNETETKKTETNKPRLGLRMVDNEANRLADLGVEASRKYFEDHLKPDHMVQVVLETTNFKPDGEAKDPIYYILNIDIRYLMGPALYGQIDIENCALPGEYIYANADKVSVEMDPELGITEQSWRMYPNDERGHRLSAEGYPLDKVGHRLVSGTDNRVADTEDDYDTVYTPAFYDLKTAEFWDPTVTEKLVHIPAYYYQNGWELTFNVTANGEKFESALPYYVQKLNTETKKMEDTTVPNLANRLQVHNYHRMRPVYDDKIIDLRLTSGARIYIEDEADMQYFFEYLSAMQGDSRTLPAYMPEFVHFTTPDGHVVNPRYGAGLDFYQQGRFSVPTSDKFTNDSDHPIYFTGSYHGNGHRMLIPAGASIYIANGHGTKGSDPSTWTPGYMYNTGFVSEVANDDTTIFDENYGVITNCFYFNSKEKGSLTGMGTLRNCYQNTPVATDGSGNPKFPYNELMRISTHGFRYGQVAYNLNGFYLQKRHLLLHKEAAFADIDERWRKGADNNPWALGARDKALRGMQGSVAAGSTADRYDDYSVEYIEQMFNNGDYRYAFYNLPEGFTQFTEALRDADEPNYFDRHDLHNEGKWVSRHDRTHKVDEQRWCDNHQEYHPLFDKDYLFFGENLTVDAEHQDFLPEAFTPANRVYRVGGFYGSAADKGYFMNRNAYLDAPLMTAIDFVGYRDRDMYEADDALRGLSYGANGAHGVLKRELEGIFDSNTGTGWIIETGRHEVFMPPTLDLPWTWTSESDLKHDFEKFDVNSDKVTHNLLIYTENLPEAIDVMDAYHYIGRTYGLGSNPSAQLLAQHPDTEIRAHHIVDYGPEEATDGSGLQSSVPRVYDDYLHLADLHDFNAPVAFSAREAWYNRKPSDYATPYTMIGVSGTKRYTSAWEGICLPFDIMKVYAASTNPTLMTDMGEITHFFGDDSGDDWKGHEYWLRRLVGVEPGQGTDCDELQFERPTEANLGGYSERTGDYVYTNTAIYDLYKDLEYDTPNVPDYTHDYLYHNPNGTHSRTIGDYRYLSRNMPYVVSYPGEQYYEFDLSGEFYKKCVEAAGDASKVVTAVPQTICYMANGGAREKVTVPVTDDAPMAQYTVGGSGGSTAYTMKGTFVHVTDDADLAQSVLYDKVENLAVLDGIKASDADQSQAGTLLSLMHHSGTSFKAYEGTMVVPPFRTYVTGSKALRSDAPVIIGSRGSLTPDQVIDDEDPEEMPAADEADADIKVWVEGSKLVIETPYDLETNIYNISGQLVRHIRAYEGVNRYSGLHAGFYVVLGRKVMLSPQ